MNESKLPSISAIIITQNEERCIEPCLKSLTWVDELIVVDGGSTDATIEIAKKYTSKLYSNPWPGFFEQRQYALSKVTKDWVISLDADEELSVELYNEIQRILSSNNCDVNGFKVARLSQYLGKWIYHGEWYPDWQLRLFRRSEAYVEGKFVHESFMVKGETNTLPGHIKHNSYRGVKDHFLRMRLYSTLMALRIDSEGVKWSLYNALMDPVTRGWKNYITQRGYLEGYRGIIINVIIVYYRIRTHTQLFSLQYIRKKRT